MAQFDPEALKGFQSEAQLNMEALRQNTYPGRGIIMGVNNTGDLLTQVYWIMGRSENSRNRLLIRESDVVRTVPYDPSKITNPSLIIYNAMRIAETEDGLAHIVSNGDQTDTVAEYFAKHRGYNDALKTRTYEPDSPNFTPRITGIIYPHHEYTSYVFSTIKKAAPDSDEAVRRSILEDVNGIKPGEGLCFHTYKGDGDPLPAFEDRPYPVLLEGDAENIADNYWNLLNLANKVSLVVKGIHRETGEISYAIRNQLGDQPLG